MKIDIYLISMDKDIKRREKLAGKFPTIYPHFLRVGAIDATNYENKNMTNCYYSKQTTPLTLGEKCCAISHLQALELFLETKKKWCVIIEDDIEGGDADFEVSSSVINNLKIEDTNALIILGGQQGLKNSKFLSGYKIANLPIWRLPKYSHWFITRACCYAISRDMAKQIVSKQRKNLSRSDQWKDFCSKTGTIYYSNFFIHPTDLRGSRLEVERKKTSLEKMKTDGLKSLINRNVAKLRVMLELRINRISKVEIK